MQTEPVVQLNFSQAIALVKTGYRLTRQGWNSKGSYICFMLDYRVIRGCIALKRPSWELEFGWQPNQEDMLLDDWIVVN